MRRVHIAGHSVFDSNTGVHDHLHCERCGRVQDLPPRRGRPPRPGGAGAWRIERASHTFFGLCPDCRRKGGRA